MLSGGIRHVDPVLLNQKKLKYEERNLWLIEYLLKIHHMKKVAVQKVQLPFFTKSFVYKSNLSVNLRLMVLENKL